MKSRRLTGITRTMLIVALAMPVPLTGQQTRYTVEDLGAFGGTFSWAFGLNNRGQVTGFATCPSAAITKPVMPFCGNGAF